MFSFFFAIFIEILPKFRDFVNSNNCIGKNNRELQTYKYIQILPLRRQKMTWHLLKLRANSVSETLAGQFASLKCPLQGILIQELASYYLDLEETQVQKTKAVF